MNKNIFILIVGCLCLLIGCKSEVFELPQPPITNDTSLNVCDTLNITYQNKVKQIIDLNCATSGCHDVNSGSGNFTNFNGLKPKLESGFFRSRVLRDKNMPPSGPLPQNTLDELNCWLEKGYPEN